MLTDMPTIPFPPDFFFDVERPTFWTELYSYYQIQILAVMSEAGFELSDGTANYMKVEINKDRDFDKIIIADSVEGLDG